MALLYHLPKKHVSNITSVIGGLGGLYGAYVDMKHEQLGLTPQ